MKQQQKKTKLINIYKKNSKIVIDFPTPTISCISVKLKKYNISIFLDNNSMFSVKYFASTIKRSSPSNCVEGKPSYYFMHVSEHSIFF